MASDMARVATLGNSAISVLGAVCVDGVGAVVLLVALALGAGKIGSDLGTNTSTVANLDLGDL